MNCHGILKTDDYITRFFRLSTQMVVELCYRLIPDMSQPGSTTVRNKVFHTIDAYVKLIALLVKHSGDSSNTSTKVLSFHCLDIVHSVSSFSTISSKQIETKIKN